MSNPSRAPWEIKSIISDLLSLLSHFNVWECTWIPRTENSQAHDLGQLGLKLDFDSFCTFEAFPPCSVILI